METAYFTITINTTSERCEINATSQGKTVSVCLLHRFKVGIKAALKKILKCSKVVSSGGATEMRKSQKAVVH